MKVLKLTPERCTGCLRCEIACSYMQTGQFQPSKSVIRVSPFEGYTSYAPYTCTQCAEGWCMTACPVGAIRINAAGAKDDAVSRWAKNIALRRGYWKAVVAVAAKNARLAWAALTKGESFTMPA